MDPHTATREQFTTGLTSMPLPTGTLAPEWKELAEQLRTLLLKLAFHPAMEPNLQQTYMTPAASKNNVYFMWDFVGRTLSMLYNVEPTLENMSEEGEKKWNDVSGRAVYAGMLITNQMEGALDMMTEATYPGQKGKHPERRRGRKQRIRRTLRRVRSEMVVSR
ncbi:hypothetical protein BDR22DRAFT_718717 [Usnea florida]